jgi:hypothetical protein
MDHLLISSLLPWELKTYQKRHCEYSSTLPHKHIEHWYISLLQSHTQEGRKGIQQVLQQVGGLVLVVFGKLPQSGLGRLLRDASCVLRGYR